MITHLHYRYKSCKAFIGLTIRAKIGGGQPLLLETLDQSDRVGAKSPIFDLFSLIVTQPQGCGLGLQTVSRRTNVSSRSRLEKNCQHLGLSHLRLMPKTNFRPNCAVHSTQCKRALDVVSRCCSYYWSSY